MQSLRLEADVVAKNSAIAACARGFAWPAALQLLEDLAVPGEVSYTSVINACGNGHEWSLAVHLLSLMKSSWISPSRISCNATISACEKGQAWREALSLLDVGSCDVVAYSAAMSACAHATHWQEALELLSLMKTTQVQPDVVAFSTGIFACEQAACWQGALELLCPDPVAYTSCIGACALAQKWEMATHLWELLAQPGKLGIQPTAMSYAAVAFAHGAARRWQQVLELQVQVRKLGWLPSGLGLASRDAGFRTCT